MSIDLLFHSGEYAFGDAQSFAANGISINRDFLQRLGQVADGQRLEVSKEFRVVNSDQRKIGFMRNERNPGLISTWIIVLLRLHITCIRDNMCVGQYSIVLDDRTGTAGLSGSE